MSVLEIEEKALSLSDEEKLVLIGRLWKSMEPTSGEPPAWHDDVLAERMKRIETGEANFTPWSEARESLGLT